METKSKMAFALMAIALSTVAASVLASADPTATTYKVDIPLSDDTYAALSTDAAAKGLTTEQLISNKSATTLEKDYLNSLRTTIAREVNKAYNAKDAERLKAIQACVNK